jgi:hypothetical protein
MPVYGGTDVAAPRLRLSYDVGESVLIRISDDYPAGLWESSSDAAVPATWVVLSGRKQAQVRQNGLVDLPAVVTEVENVAREGRNTLAGKLTSEGFLIPLSEQSEVDLAVQAKQAYGW